MRKRIWTAIGGPGTVLVSGEVARAVAPREEGQEARVTVEPLGRLTATAKDELAAEAERIAPFRGAETAELRTARL